MASRNSSNNIDLTSYTKSCDALDVSSSSSPNTKPTKQKQKKRNKKLTGKQRLTVSTNVSKNSDEEKTSQDEEGKKAKKYPRNRVKKKDQYRNQVIEDQFGVFEYDKDPDGYLKARKRMLNRKSALRTRSRKSTKFDVLNDKVKDLEDKSKNLEMQNIDLKTENSDLQKQVQHLMGIINKMKNEKEDDIHKRFKISECEEQEVDPISTSKNNFKIPSQNDSGSFLLEEEESEFLSSGEDEFGILKTESWLNQNDIIGQVLESPTKRVGSSTKDHEGSFSSANPQLDLSNEEQDRFVLQRGDEVEDGNNFLGDTVGNFLSQASMLTLTVVMCLVLVFSNLSSEEDQKETRDYHANIPGGRIPLTENIIEMGQQTKSYLQIGVVSVLIIGLIFFKFRGCLKRLSFDPRRKAKENS